MMMMNCMMLTVIQAGITRSQKSTSTQNMAVAHQNHLISMQNERKVTLTIRNTKRSGNERNPVTDLACLCIIIMRIRVYQVTSIVEN